VSETPATDRSRRDGLFSQKRLIQAGSVAAAIASIFGLALTVGDRVTGLFGSDATPKPELHEVAIDRIKLRTYLATRTNPTIDDKPDYTPKELKSDVVVVDIRASYAHAKTGEHFPVRITLERRAPTGSADVVSSHTVQYYFESETDQCVCHDYFELPRQPGAYRAEVQILDPSGRRSELVIDQAESRWLRV
jgi:hypothetical protein